MKLFALALAASASLLTAQVSGVSHASPRLGFVPGATPSELQPILGLPGATRLGDPISLPFPAKLYLAPGHQYALAEQADGVIGLIALRANQMEPALIALPGALQNPELIAFSPSGHAAILYSQSSNRLQVWNGLPTAPQLVQNISTVSLSDVHQAAVSDDAQIVLVGDESGNVDRVSDTPAVPLYHAAHIASLGFGPGTHNAIIVDSGSNSVAIVDSATGRFEALPSPPNRCEPDEAAATADGRTVLVACPAQRLVWSVNRDSGAINVTKIPVSPLQMDRLAARDTFLFSPPDEHGSYWMVSIHPDGLSLSFVGAHVSGAGQ
ncbi:MAG: hypothetical protein JOZ22_12870 [Acidobacteriia bacterium]|nr:hypothetical protein [Terriglobia bacterium]